MKIGFTGTQQKITEAQANVLLELLQKLNPTECHHGDCVGADTAFHIIAAYLDKVIIIHPPANEYKRAFNNSSKTVIKESKAYLVRNKDIVNETDLLIAIPSGEEVLRSGTWSTVRYARKNKKRIYIIIPNGTINEELHDVI